MLSLILNSRIQDIRVDSLQSKCNIDKLFWEIRLSRSHSKRSLGGQALMVEGELKFRFKKPLQKHSRKSLGITMILLKTPHTNWEKVIRTSKIIEPKSQTSKLEGERSQKDEVAGRGARGWGRGIQEYEVELVQAFDLVCAKRKDGWTYIDAIALGGSVDKTDMFTVEDTVLATKAVFGIEILPAFEHGRTMYTVRPRVGLLLMKMQKRYGKINNKQKRYGKIDNTDELIERKIRAERNSGVISNNVGDVQKQNYLMKMEQKQKSEKGSWWRA